MSKPPEYEAPYMRVAQAWRLILGVTAMFALVIGWQALDLDRHEEIPAHQAAAQLLAASEARYAALKENLNRRIRQLEAVDAQSRKDFRELERSVIELRIKLYQRPK